MELIVTISQLNDYIKKLCSQPSNQFAQAFFDLHIKQVEKYSVLLAGKLGADKDVVQVAALIHDVAAISDFSKLAQHASEGAILARELLAKYPLSNEQKEKVFHCIETHSQPIALGADISEAVCVSNADAISQIAQPLYWSYYIFNIRKFSFEEGFKWYQQRVESHWNTLIEPAKELIEIKYKQALTLFEK